jgi:Sec-independent protein translocase protein TatA
VNILGMGTLEILVILLVAFIVMGPDKMVDAGRLLGRAAREARRLSEGLPNLILDEAEVDRTEKQPEHRDAGPSSFSPSTAADARESAPDHDGPVAFKPSESAAPNDETGGTKESERS